MQKAINRTEIEKAQLEEVRNRIVDFLNNHVVIALSAVMFMQMFGKQVLFLLEYIDLDGLCLAYLSKKP